MEHGQWLLSHTDFGSTTAHFVCGRTQGHKDTGTQRPRDKKLLQYSAERGSPRGDAGAKHFAGPVFTFQDICHITYVAHF